MVKRVFLCLKFFLKLFGRKRSLGFVDQECIKEMFLFVNSFSFLDEKNHQVSGLRTLFADPELSLLWLAAPGIMIRRQIQAMF